jgi:hypothetical protein
MLPALGLPRHIMFKRYVILAYTFQFRPMEAHAHAWEFMEASAGGQMYRVWPGKWKTGSPAMSGLAFAFKHEATARLEYERIRNQKNADTPKPQCSSLPPLADWGDSQSARPRSREDDYRGRAPRLAPSRCRTNRCPLLSGHLVFLLLSRPRCACSI